MSYYNPYIPEDSVQVKVKVKYGPDFDKAAYWDLNGDGKIETVDIRFKDPVNKLPDQLKFYLLDALGASHNRIALTSESEIEYGKKSDQSPDLGHLIVTMAKPFPYGITSVAFPDTSGRTFKQLNIPMVDGNFRIEDSLPPVILSADVLKPDQNQTLTRVRVTYSESISLDEASALEPVVLKRDTSIFTAKQMPMDHIEKISSTQYTYYLAASGIFSPVGGDSIAINNNGETRDLFSRSPSVKTFAPMGGPIPGQKVSDFFVTFSNGSRSKASGAPESPNRDRIFIPVDGSGYALPGNENGKCGNCTAKIGDAFAGSVIVVVTKYPVTYEFFIYSNLGQLVARDGGKIEEADLLLLEKQDDPSRDPNLTEYKQRIVWTGRTHTGQMAGTGAYILKAVFRYEQSFKTGARPSLSTKFTKFGFLRACCESQNSPWYE